MPHLTIVADFMAKPEKEDFLKTHLTQLISPTLKEAGCVQYDLHQDLENPRHFLFFENWETRELWQAHMKSDHLARFKAGAEDAIEKLNIFEMTQIK